SCRSRQSILRWLLVFWNQFGRPNPKLRRGCGAVSNRFWIGRKCAAIAAGENPARLRGHLDHLLPAHRRLARVKHHAALPYADMPVFIRELREREGNTARALEFLILTAARVGEVLGARWDEISGDLWTVPASRMKGRREHRVPLSGQAVEMLQALPR